MRKKVFKCIFIILFILIIIIFVNFVPALFLKTSKMSKLSGEFVDVYYESEVAAAIDVFKYADNESSVVAKKLGFLDVPNVDIYIYDFQSTMQMKKYGLIAPLLGLDWYIGDNIGTNVILTSPANPGKMHTYDNIKYAVLHEIIHAYISVLNDDVDLWLTEGSALYLSNGQPFYKVYIEQFDIPTYKDVCSNNPLVFSKSGGYIYAHTFIEFLDITYGWDSVLELIKTENYEKVLGRTKKDIYEEWVLYIHDYYQ